jgi:hypothetical protein
VRSMSEAIPLPPALSGAPVLRLSSFSKACPIFCPVGLESSRGSSIAEKPIVSTHYSTLHFRRRKSPGIIAKGSCIRSIYCTMEVQTPHARTSHGLCVVHRLTPGSDHGDIVKWSGSANVGA